MVCPESCHLYCSNQHVIDDVNLNAFDFGTLSHVPRSAALNGSFRGLERNQEWFGSPQSGPAYRVVACWYGARYLMQGRSDVVNIHFIEKVEHYFNDRLAVFVSGQDEHIITSAAKTSAFRKWLDTA